MCVYEGHCIILLPIFAVQIGTVQTPPLVLHLSEVQLNNPPDTAQPISK